MPMNTAEVLELYEYNRWAHERVLAAAEAVGPDRYSETLAGSFPSLRATLEHMLATEVIWLSRWEGHSLGEAPDYTGCRDVKSLASIWGSFWHRQFSFLRDLSEEDLGKLIAIRTRGGIETVQPLSDTLIHVVNHSSYHRGQAVSQVRQLGGVPEATDYFIYCLGRSDS
jgi:uncharacterized damage-inducible protein DinB